MTNIDYIELYSTDLVRTQEFYEKTFSWKFIPYGDTYIAFDGVGIDGGFEKVESVSGKGPLIVLHDTNLEEVQARIVANGGEVNVPLFSFPGGERFHFYDDSGNELAVWRKK